MCSSTHSYRQHHLHVSDPLVLEKVPNRGFVTSRAGLIILEKEINLWSLSGIET
jgi:hypothetical protein